MKKKIYVFDFTWELKLLSISLACVGEKGEVVFVCSIGNPFQVLI